MSKKLRVCSTIWLVFYVLFFGFDAFKSVKSILSDIPFLRDAPFDPEYSTMMWAAVLTDLLLGALTVVCVFLCIQVLFSYKKATGKLFAVAVIGIFECVCTVAVYAVASLVYSGKLIIAWQRLCVILLPGITLLLAVLSKKKTPECVYVRLSPAAAKDGICRLFVLLREKWDDYNRNKRMM